MRTDGRENGISAGRGCQRCSPGRCRAVLAIDSLSCTLALSLAVAEARTALGRPEIKAGSEDGPETSTREGSGAVLAMMLTAGSTKTSSHSASGDDQAARMTHRGSGGRTFGKTFAMGVQRGCSGAEAAVVVRSPGQSPSGSKFPPSPCQSTCRLPSPLGHSWTWAVMAGRAGSKISPQTVLKERRPSRECGFRVAYLGWPSGIEVRELMESPLRKMLLVCVTWIGCWF